MATQAEIYKEKFDTGALVVQDLAILAKPWIAGVTCPDPLFDSNGIVSGALADFLSLGEVAKGDGASLTPDVTYNPIEGYGSRTPRRRLLESEGLALELTPQECRQIMYMIQNNWDEGNFTTTSTGGWRGDKTAGDRPKYWTMFVLGEDSNDETGEPIYQWWFLHKMGTDKGGANGFKTDSTSAAPMTLNLFQDGSNLYSMGVDGPGFAPIAAELGFGTGS